MSPKSSFRLLPRAVIVLGIASFFTDFSSEMIYPLLPVFLTSVLGAGAIAIGVIEGIAESTASILKIVSGLWTDRIRRRRPFIIWGYGLAGLVRPLIGVAMGWWFVLLMRFLDRVGKGLRTSPRDALITDVTDPSMRGTAFGFHRSLDHAGAVVGPLVAAGLIALGLHLRVVFLLAFIPAAVVMGVLVWGIHEDKPLAAGDYKPLGLRRHWGDLGRDFKLLLLVLFIFTLGNSTDAFLILRLKDAGVDAEWLAILWALHHVVKMVSTYRGGRWADRVGSRLPIVIGWAFYALVYLAFARFTSEAALIAIFLAYGIYYGLTEPAEKLWIASLVPKNLRGTAFGYYHGVIGLGALPASALFGFIWYEWGSSVAFGMGAALAAAACVLLYAIRPAGPVGAAGR
ncbi:MAG: MFS transporter [bacterium]|nr:MFS transporter [bacterium]